jgi:hypothetical protein
MAIEQATPCTDWGMRALLLHVSDSLGVLTNALQAGRIGTGPLPGHEPTTEAGPVTCLRHQARDLLGACAAGAEKRLGRRPRPDGSA